MCGIAGGIWSDPQAPLGADALKRMTEALRHRGPDDEGFHISDVHVRRPYPARPGIALGHRRLAVIDPAGSHQPLASEDETIWLVFNGEIYNFQDLRRRLEGKGHRFRTMGDAEVIVHLYEDEGLGFLDHLVGMFALALWDQRRGRLVLARDRLGQKPLVYRVEPGRLLFASELKGVLAAPGVPRELDPTAVDEYLLYQYVPYPNTIFRGIRKLPPGHRAVYQDGKLTVAPYWTVDFSREDPRPPHEYVDLIRSRLSESVRLRMQSDVPLGAFLSGGIDSSIIVALMQQLSDQQVKTFSVGFPVAEYDETSYARQVAEHLGTDHHEFRVEPSGLEVLPKIVWHYDEPFADSSAIPTYYVSKLTREHVTVALSGDGGDELFAGYPRYRAVKLGGYLDRLPQPFRWGMTTGLWQSLPASPRQKGLMRRWKRFTSAMAMTPIRRYAEWIAIFNETRRAALYTDAFLHSLGGSDPLEFLNTAYRRCEGRDAITATSLTDLVTYLPCDLMTKVDIASMANSLECRQPFLDHRVVELAVRMPLQMKMRGWQGKWILRNAFGSLLPRAILKRPKMGFGVPLDAWFRHELKEMAYDVLLDSRTTGRGYFLPETVSELLEEHTRGQFDHAYRLWALLVLELWQREWVDP